MRLPSRMSSTDGSPCPSSGSEYATPNDEEEALKNSASLTSRASHAFSELEQGSVLRPGRTGLGVGIEVGVALVTAVGWGVAVDVGSMTGVSVRIGIRVGCCSSSHAATRAKADYA